MPASETVVEQVQVPENLQKQPPPEDLTPKETIRISVSGLLKSGETISRTIEGQVPKGSDDKQTASGVFAMIQQSGGWLTNNKDNPREFEFYPYENFTKITVQVEQVVGITL
jgi:hypothetical protein